MGQSPALIPGRLTSQSPYWVTVDRDTVIIGPCVFGPRHVFMTGLVWNMSAFLAPLSFFLGGESVTSMHAAEAQAASVFILGAIP